MCYCQGCLTFPIVSPRGTSQASTGQVEQSHSGCLPWAGLMCLAVKELQPKYFCCVRARLEEGENACFNCKLKTKPVTAPQNTFADALAQRLATVQRFGLSEEEIAAQSYLPSTPFGEGVLTDFTSLE